MSNCLQHVIRYWSNSGFEEVRQRGSYKQFRHIDGRSITVPFHSNGDISTILLRQIAKDIDLAIDELIHNR